MALLPTFADAGRLYLRDEDLTSPDATQLYSRTGLSLTQRRVKLEVSALVDLSFSIPDLLYSNVGDRHRFVQRLSSTVHFVRRGANNRQKAPLSLRRGAPTILTWETSRKRGGGGWFA